MKRMKQYLLAVTIFGLMFAALPSQTRASGYIIAGGRSESTANAAGAENSAADGLTSGSGETASADNLGTFGSGTAANSETFADGLLSALFNIGLFGSGN